jgi:cyclase
LFLAIVPEQVGLGTSPAIKIGSGCGRLTAHDHHWVTETAKMMALRFARYVSDYPHRMELFQQEIDSGKYPSGTPLTKSEIEDLKNAVKGGKEASDAVSAEFRSLKVKIPDVTFDNELDVNLGNREVQLKYLGRGNTVGDAIAYLLKEKILITGDLVDSPVPYLGAGFPIEQVAT